MSSTSTQEAMQDDGGGAEPAATTQTARRVPNATTRVVMAFPFSSIRISSDTVACRDLALLVGELCDALTREGTPDDLAELGDRARALAERFEV